MIRYNNISRPIYDSPNDPPATSHDPRPNSGGGRDPQPPRIDALAKTQKNVTFSKMTNHATTGLESQTPETTANIISVEALEDLRKSGVEEPRHSEKSYLAELVKSSNLTNSNRPHAQIMPQSDTCSPIHVSRWFFYREPTRTLMPTDSPKVAPDRH